MNNSYSLNIYGSTGQIGSKSLKILKNFFPKIKINLLLANKNYKKLIKQATLYSPKAVCLIDITKTYLPLLGGYKNSPIQGKIINISSISGLRSNPFTSPYCASKFALEAFSDSLRCELMIYGVDVILIEPGPFKTDIWNKAPDPNNNDFTGSDYENSLRKFYKLVIEFGRKGWDPKIIGNRIKSILQDPNPATRHIITPKRFSHYVLSGILPTRIYDKLIGKKLGLLKK